MPEEVSPKDPDRTPLLSVIMANHNGAPYIGAAIAAVLCQSMGDLEVIVSDDASSDDSATIVEGIATRDPRVRLLRSATCGGPAVARNRALEAARGQWISIVDSDDLIHPERMERMIDSAERLGVDVVADDLIYFGANLGKTLLGALRLEVPWLPTKSEFLEAEMARPAIPVGYLKPLIRRSALGQIKYRTYMTIGEDFDLLFRVLVGGARLAILPQAYYLYRRHTASISHRLSTPDLEGIIRAGAELEQELSPDLLLLVERRKKTLVHQRDFAKLVASVKARRIFEAAQMLVATPALISPLFRSLTENMSRRLASSRDRLAETTHLSLKETDAESADPVPYRTLSVPTDPTSWTPLRAAELTARTGRGPVRLRAHGRAGLDALGYVPGWETAELISPQNGWTEQERLRIASLPWPVTMT